MNDVKFIEIENTLTGEIDIHAIVKLSENSFESMPKAEYEKRLAEQANKSGTL